MNMSAPKGTASHVVMHRGYRDIATKIICAGLIPSGKAFEICNAERTHSIGAHFEDVYEFDELLFEALHQLRFDDDGNAKRRDELWSRATKFILPTNRQGGENEND